MLNEIVWHVTSFRKAALCINMLSKKGASKLRSCPHFQKRSRTFSWQKRRLEYGKGLNSPFCHYHHQSRYKTWCGLTDELSQHKVTIHSYNDIALDAELKMHCLILMWHLGVNYNKYTFMRTCGGLRIKADGPDAAHRLHVECLLT